MRAGRTHHGFTLIEMVMVLAIIGVVAAIALPRYARSINHYRVELAARRVVADIEFARGQARRQSKNVTVYVLTEYNAIAIDEVEGMRVDGENYYTVYSDDPYNVTLVNSNFGGNESLAFNGFGRPKSGGSVDVQAGGSTITVTLDPDTGRASFP